MTAVRQMYEQVYPQYHPTKLSIRQVNRFAWNEHAHMLDVYEIPADLPDVYRGRWDDDIMISIESFDGTLVSRVECQVVRNPGHFDNPSRRQMRLFAGSPSAIVA